MLLLLQEDLYSESVEIDHRVHSRIIRGRGRGVVVAVVVVVVVVVAGNVVAGGAVQ